MHIAPDGKFDAPQLQVKVPITTVKVSGLYSSQMVRKPLLFTAHWHLSALSLACCFFPSLTTCLKRRQPQFYLSYQIARNCQYKQILLHRPSDFNCHHGQKEHTKKENSNNKYLLVTVSSLCSLYKAPNNMSMCSYLGTSGAWS